MTGWEGLELVSGTGARGELYSDTSAGAISVADRGRV